ncbi:MAG TPA: hypothetical protein V6C65_30235, partial [Allocoleopsis sp.]
MDIAADMIQKELQVTDFLQWLGTCYSVYSRYSDRGGVVGRLAKIVDLSKAKFKFLPEPRIVFDSVKPIPGLFMRFVTVFEEREANKTKKRKIRREEFENYNGKVGKPVYLMHAGERASNRKDKWLWTKHPGGFITIMEPYGTIEQAEAAGASKEELTKMNSGTLLNRELYWDAIQKSAGVTWYDAVEIPEEFTGSDQEVEEAVVQEEEVAETAETSKVARQTAEERRKANGTILVSTPEVASSMFFHPEVTGHSINLYGHNRFEIPITDINNWNAKEIYYGHEDDSALIQLIAMITGDTEFEVIPDNSRFCMRPNVIRRHASSYKIWTSMKWWRLNKNRVKSLNIQDHHAYSLQHFFDTDVILVKTSKNNAKYYRDFNKVQEFFIQIQNKTITMSNRLIKWNTARLIRQGLEKCAFLYNFPFNQEFADLYEELCNYVNMYYREIEKPISTNKIHNLPDTVYNDMIEHLDKVYTFQSFVQNAPRDREGIAAMANQMFNNPELRSGMAVEPEMMSKLQEVTEFALACGKLLNFMPILTG